MLDRSGKVQTISKGGKSLKKGSMHMLNLKRQLTFRRKLWLTTTIVLFVAAGFVNWIPTWDKGEGLIYWELWMVWLGGPYPEYAAGPIVMLTVFLAVTASVFAFVLHHFVGMAWESFWGRRISN
jgi:hypothetical protein